MLNVLRAGALLALALAGGCATPSKPATEVLRSDLMLIGTFQSLGEVDVMTGDVPEVAQAYRLKSADGTEFVFVVDRACSPGPDSGQNYLVLPARERDFWVPAPNDYWYATVCIPLDAQTAEYLWLTGQRRKLR